MNKALNPLPSAGVPLALGGPGRGVRGKGVGDKDHLFCVIKIT
jgi:hypothetical protein